MSQPFVAAIFAAVRLRSNKEKPIKRLTRQEAAQGTAYARRASSIVRARPPRPKPAQLRCVCERHPLDESWLEGSETGRPRSRSSSGNSAVSLTAWRGHRLIKRLLVSLFVEPLHHCAGGRCRIWALDVAVELEMEVQSERAKLPPRRPLDALEPPRGLPFDAPSPRRGL